MSAASAAEGLNGIRLVFLLHLVLGWGAGGQLAQAHHHGSCPKVVGEEAVSLICPCFLSSWGMRWSPNKNEN